MKPSKFPHRLSFNSFNLRYGLSYWTLFIKLLLIHEIPYLRSASQWMRYISGDLKISMGSHCKILRRLIVNGWFFILHLFQQFPLSGDFVLNFAWLQIWLNKTLRLLIVRIFQADEALDDSLWLLFFERIAKSWSGCLVHNVPLDTWLSTSMRLRPFLKLLDGSLGCSVGSTYERLPLYTFAVNNEAGLRTCCAISERLLLIRRWWWGGRTRWPSWAIFIEKGQLHQIII